MILRIADQPARRLEIAPILARRLVTAEHSQRLAVTWMSIEGEHPAIHLLETDTVYCYLDGSGWIRIGDGERQTIGAGDIAFVAAGISFSYGGELEYLVLQAPPLTADAVVREPDLSV